MNMTTILKKILIFLMSAVFLTFAHPSISGGSQEIEKEYDAKIAQLQNYFAYESPLLQDSNSMNKLFLLYTRMFPELRDNVIRKPESKRQVRYRQCYFNPISCFKK